MTIRKTRIHCIFILNQKCTNVSALNAEQKVPRPLLRSPHPDYRQRPESFSMLERCSQLSTAFSALMSLVPGAWSALACPFPQRTVPTVPKSSSVSGSRPFHFWSISGHNSWLSPFRWSRHFYVWLAHTNTLSVAKFIRQKSIHPASYAPDSG